MIRHPSHRPSRMGLLGFGSRDPIADALGRRLDDDWHWFRHVATAGPEAIDAVCVGPGGTWVITMAGARGRFTRRNGHWYRWNPSTESWVPWDPTPITAARLGAQRLSLYLERAGLPAAVTGVLLPPPDMSVETAPTEPMGVLVEREPDRISALMVADAVLSQPQVDRIVALLDPRQPLPRLAPSTPNG